MITRSAFAAAALAAALGAASMAAADLVFPDLSYRTGAYASGGIPFSDGYRDYFTLLNERDGGIGGVLVRVVECETGYNTARGVECYEATKGEGALIYQPLSTGISYQLIPKVTADGIALHTMGYGRTSAANGRVFSHVFNYPSNYWDAATVAIEHLLAENGGDLEGRKIALLYHNSAFGKEPIRTLELLAEKHGFRLSLLAVDHPGQEQKSQWLRIRRERPDHVLIWGWGVMNQVALREAANVRYPMGQVIGNWWAAAEPDVAPLGAAADGYKALNFHRVGPLPLFDDLQTHVHGPGLAAGDGRHLGSVLYIRGLYAAFLAAEAARNAQAIHGVAEITPAMMRDGMEALSITAETMKAAGVDGIGPEFSVSCAAHGGAGQVILQQWDGQAGRWRMLTDFIDSDRALIAPLIEADSAAFAAEHGIEPRCE